MVKPDMKNRPRRSETSKSINDFQGATSAGQKYQEWRNANPDRTTGWSPTCDCPPADPVPATVLDPFGGSGTTGKVALELGRSAILIELNPAYCDLARQRTTTTIGLAI